MFYLDALTAVILAALMAAASPAAPVAVTPIDPPPVVTSSMTEPAPDVETGDYEPDVTDAVAGDPEPEHDEVVLLAQWRIRQLWSAWEASELAASLGRDVAKYAERDLTYARQWRTEWVASGAVDGEVDEQYARVVAALERQATGE